MKSLPTKTVSELVQITFNFFSAVEWEEELVSATVEAVVWTGLDYQPSNIIDGAASVSGTSVTQLIHAGMPGVIYNLVCTAVGGSGNTYIQSLRLAVLSDDNSFNPGNSLQISGNLPDGISGVAYSSSLLISGGFPPYEFDDITAGTPPPWMSFNVLDSSLVCAGLPDEQSTTNYTFTPQVRDAPNNLAASSQSLSITHIQISGHVPDGSVGELSSGTYAEVDGQTPVTYAITAGTFPAGLTLASDGSWSGQFTVGGSYTWDVTGTDSVGNTSTITDGCLVVTIEWWLTFQDTISTNYTKLWISSDAETFPTVVTPGYGSTNVSPGPYDIALNQALIFGSTGQRQRFSDVTDPLSNSFEAGPGISGSIAHVRDISGILFIIPTTGTNYWYSVNRGSSWVSVAVPASTIIFDIAQLSDGTWVTGDRGASAHFYYSSQVIPTTWIQGPASNLGSGGFADGWLVSSGSAVMSFDTQGRCIRTEDGINYARVATALFPTNSRTDAIYLPNTNAVIGWVVEGGTYVRSVDDGLSWDVLTSPSFDIGTSVSRFDGFADTVVASSTTGIYKSADAGLSWTKSTLPVVTPQTDGWWCGHVRRSPV